LGSFETHRGVSNHEARYFASTGNGGTLSSVQSGFETGFALA